MPVPATVLALGAGFVGLLLFLNKREKAQGGETSTPPTALPPPVLPVQPGVPGALPPLPGGFIQATNTTPSPRPDGSTLSQVTTNPDGTPHSLGTPFVHPTDEKAQDAVDLANKLGLALFEIEVLKTGGKLARVTTSDPAPSGDLVIRTSPSESAAQVPGGGAEKDATVTIIRDVDGTFSEIFWRGGNRRPFAQGFAKRKFLTILPNPVTGT